MSNPQKNRYHPPDPSLIDTPELMQWEQRVYDLCAYNDNANIFMRNISQLFAKYPLNADLLSVFLCAPARCGQGVMLNTLLDVAVKHRPVSLQSNDLTAAFNHASDNKRMDMMNIFTQRTSVIEDSLGHLSHNDYLMKNGVIDTFESIQQQRLSRPTHYSMARESRDSHAQNVLLFASSQSSNQSLKYLLDTGHPVAPEVLVQSALHASLIVHGADSSLHNLQLLATHPSTRPLFESQCGEIHQLLLHSFERKIFKSQAFDFIETYQLKKELNQTLISPHFLTKTHKI